MSIINYYYRSDSDRTNHHHHITCRAHKKLITQKLVRRQITRRADWMSPNPRVVSLLAAGALVWWTYMVQKKPLIRMSICVYVHFLRCGAARSAFFLYAARGIRQWAQEVLIQWVSHKWHLVIYEICAKHIYIYMNGDHPTADGAQSGVYMCIYIVYALVFDVYWFREIYKGCVGFARGTSLQVMCIYILYQMYNT